VTRYQSATATVDIRDKTMMLVADSAQKVQVLRDQQLSTSDRFIRYIQTRDSTLVQSDGTYLLRDPANTQAPEIRGVGEWSYMMAPDHAIVLTHGSFPANNGGDTWQMSFERTKLIGDSTGLKDFTMYSRNLRMTSCLDSVPDFFFRLKNA